MFVNLDKAYDKMNSLELQNIWQKYRAEGRMLNIITVIYERSKLCMKINRILSE